MPACHRIGAPGVAAEEHADRVTDSHVQEAIEARGGGMEPSAAEPITEEAEPAPRSAPTTPSDVGERADRLMVDPYDHRAVPTRPERQSPCDR